MAKHRRSRKSGRTSAQKLPDEVVAVPQDSDEMLIESRKTGEITTASAAANRDYHPPKRQPSSGKYYAYQDFVEEGRRWDAMDAKDWNILIGFLLIRVASPLILINHTGIMLGILWFKYGFRFDHPALVGKIPQMTGPLLGELLLVQVLSKILFSRNYYRRRE